VKFNPPVVGALCRCNDAVLVLSVPGCAPSRLLARVRKPGRRCPGASQQKWREIMPSLRAASQVQACGPFGRRKRCQGPLFTSSFLGRPRSRWKKRGEALLDCLVRARHCVVDPASWEFLQVDCLSGKQGGL